MRAVVADQPGPPRVLQIVDLARPVAGEEQVVIAVTMAATTFIETQMRAGTSPRSPGPFPIVLGNGVGGIVDTVGIGVDPIWIGTEVVASTRGSGGYATRAVAAAGDLHRIPAGVEMCTALALLADGRTALALARAADIGQGETVVVTAAAGGVGGLLVQLAKNAGARVIGLAGGAAKLDHARVLGADVGIDYTGDGWAGELGRAASNGVDVAFDGVGGSISGPLLDNMNVAGRYMQHGAASGSWGMLDPARVAERGVKVIGLHTIGGGPSDQYDLVEEVLQLAATGAIQATVGQWFPLERAADAHAAIEARATIGKTLLII